MIESIVSELNKTTHGFKHIVEAGNKLLMDSTIDPLPTAVELLGFQSYQARMLATYLLGKLSVQNSKALYLLKTSVVYDDNWRVQEMLAKAIDCYCKTRGYQQSLSEIELWINSPLADLNRAVIEGLRIWTGRPYFKENPGVAVRLISVHKNNPSTYVRKSVGNALRDISKKHLQAVLKETENWDLNNVNVAFVYHLIFAKK